MNDVWQNKRFSSIFSTSCTKYYVLHCNFVLKSLFAYFFTSFTNEKKPQIKFSRQRRSKYICLSWRKNVPTRPILMYDCLCIISVRVFMVFEKVFGKDSQVCVYIYYVIALSRTSSKKLVIEMFATFMLEHIKLLWKFSNNFDVVVLWFINKEEKRIWLKTLKNFLHIWFKKRFSV